ncbi:MAG: T9SS type A sorting domain-containing protein [Bacteroidetes bacterium]|nr:T9SS type A sorting domain-containing protein [Bacteroidota bacterium]MBK8659469.1 T9SS type A sorting domain-containing protein [Bacteroidota bacterium]
MKIHYNNTILTVCLLCFSAVFCRAQFVQIPDSNFVKWLNNNGYGSCVSNNQLDTTCSLLQTEDSVSCNMKQIGNLEGIQYFKNLKYLNCNDNFLLQLPPLPVTLRNLLCRNNDLTSLPFLPNSLNKLYCHNNLLTWLPPLPDSLQLLNCSMNQLSGLPELPNSLTRLSCALNVINSLPELPDSLYELDAYGNQLFCLPLLKRIVLLDFNGNNIQCKPNDGIVTYSSPSLSSLPFCADSNPHVCLLYQSSIDVKRKNIATLHPNPATTSIILSGTEPGSTATISNLHGQVLRQYAITAAQQTIDTESLPAGFYFCTLHSGHKRQVLRFMRE